MATTPLSFPTDVFAALAPADHLYATLQQSKSQGGQTTRPNGRTPPQFRPLTVNTNSLTHCNGSAVVRAGDTAVVCGVRAETLHARDNAQPPPVDLDVQNPTAEAQEIASLNLLVPNVELSTGCSPAHLPGNPPSALAQALSHRLLRLLLSSRLVRAGDLRICYERPRAEDEEFEGADDLPRVEVVGYWTLYLDIVFISLDGNPFDVAWYALLAALRNTVLPAAVWNADLEAIVCDDNVQRASRLRLAGCPVPLTFAIFEPGLAKGMLGREETWPLADPDMLEEGLCGETVTVVMDSSGQRGSLRSIEKSGGAVVGRAQMRALVELASRRWDDYEETLASQE